MRATSRKIKDAMEYLVEHVESTANRATKIAVKGVDPEADQNNGTGRTGPRADAGEER